MRSVDGNDNKQAAPEDKRSSQDLSTQSTDVFGGFSLSENEGQQPPKARRRLSSGAVLQLQRTVGNRVVRRMLQRTPASAGPAVRTPPKPKPQPSVIPDSTQQETTQEDTQSEPAQENQRTNAAPGGDNGGSNGADSGDATTGKDKKTAQQDSDAAGQSGDAKQPPAASQQEDPSAQASQAASGQAAENTDVELRMQEMPAGFTGEHQNRMQGAMGRAGVTAVSEKTMPPATEEVDEARKAVNEPQEEADAKAEKDVVEKLDDRPSPSAEIEEICDRIQGAIRDKRPPDEDAILDTEPDEEAKKAGKEMEGNVTDDADRLQQEYQEMDEKPKGTTEKQPEDIKETPPPENQPEIAADTAAPDEVPQEQMSLDEDVADNQQKIEEAGMNTEPAQLVEDGPIQEARDAQGELERTAVEDKARVDEQQKQAVVNAQADLATLQQQAQNALDASRERTVQGNEAQQEEMKLSEEQQRQQVAQQAQDIFNGAQSEVRSILDQLPSTAMGLWEAGIETASTKFGRKLDSVKKEIEERHSGVDGFFTGLSDSVFGLPEHITEQYDRAEQEFGDDVCALLRDISRTVNQIVQDTENIIKNARVEINALFDALPENLQTWAEEQKGVFGERLDGLNQEVESTRANFNQQLKQRAAQAVQEARQEVHALREAAKGLVGKITSAIAAFVEDPARFIINGLLKVVGIPAASFWAVVERIEDAIDQIAEDPVGFGNNLMEALKQGFQKFFDNIGNHLMDGLMSWLFQGLSKAGVKAPRDLSMKSILGFFLDIMGISWDKIKEKIAQKLGIGNIGLIEQAWSTISDLMERGLEGIVEFIKDLINPQEILNQIIQTAIDFVKETLIAQVAMRIIGMLNPAGAIVQALEVIYKVLKWLFEQAAPLFDLIETIVNGIGDILAGSIGGMATAIEKSLGRLLPIVIDFFADLLGLGGLPEKVADAVKGIQSYVEGLIDQAIDFVIDKAKSLFKKLGFGDQDKEDGEAADDPKVASAKATIKAKAKTELDEGEVTEEEAQKIKSDTEGKEKSVRVSVSETDNSWVYSVSPIQRKVEDVEVPKQGEPEESKVEFVSDSKGRPKEVIGHIISSRAGNTKGSTTNSSTVLTGGDELTDLLNNSGESWVRAHLLNNHLHGPAEPQNLVPAPKTTNSDMAVGVEKSAKKAVQDEKKTIRYVSKVGSYYGRSPTDHEDIIYFPRTIHVEWDELKQDKSGNWSISKKGDSGRFSVEKPQTPEKPRNPRNINQAMISDIKIMLEETNSIDGTKAYPVAAQIVRERNESGPYTSRTSVMSRMSARLEARLVSPQNDKYEENVTRNEQNLNYIQQMLNSAKDLQFRE